MKKCSIGVLSIVTCLTGGLLCADGFSREDAALLAGKDVFPGDDDESVLPELDMTDDQPEKDITPEEDSEDDEATEPEETNPRNTKDVYPQS